MNSLIPAVAKDNPQTTLPADLRTFIASSRRACAENAELTRMK